MNIDLTLYVTIAIEYAVMGFLTWWFAYHLPRQPYALILRKEQRGLAIIQKKILKTNQLDFSFGEHSYLIYWENCAYFSNHGKPILLYLEGNATPITVAKGQLNKEADSHKLHLIFGKQIVKQLAEASKNTTPMSMNIIMFILVGAVAFLVGVFVAPYLPHAKTAEAMMIIIRR